MIDSTLCYIEKDGKMLLLCRNKKKIDLNKNKWIGVGGKVENGETPEECVKREVLEETGLTLNSVHFYGIIHFRNDLWTDEEMYLYSSDDFSGTLVNDCDEGELAWVEKADVLSLPTWEGDPYFLRPLLDGEKKIEMTLRYIQDRLFEVRDELAGRTLYISPENAHIRRIQEVLDKNTGEGDHDFTGRFEGFREHVVKALLYLLDSMFPSYVKRDREESYLECAYGFLMKALSRTCEKEEAVKLAQQVLEKLPDIYAVLKKDVIAGYEGDPACKSVDEVILAYPAFLAIGTYRIAHELYLLDQKLIARIMTEYAHRKTGVDIHPGAAIGESFFIDHGTGVVIGETTVIGRHVKLYQHVTLGAKSFPVNEDGTLVKGIKRHPNVGNNVVIYAGATILGGDVTIGDNCVIGGNVWLTHSVEPGVTVNQRSEK